MTKYETVVDLVNLNKSQNLVARLTGESRTVLDVGCASGYLAEALKKQGCTVSGIEFDPEAAEIARPKLDKLVVADLETMPISEAFAGSLFDRIVFADVLEHLRDPAEVLRSSLDVLADHGEVVISIPNVAHGSLRLALLQGRWRYSDLGLLDRTHVSFVTLESLVQMIGAVGLVIREIWSTTADVLATEIEIDSEGLPEGILEWVRDQPHAFDYQFVLRASRGEAAHGLPDVRQAVPAARIRPDSRGAYRAVDLAEERHRTLVLQDQVVVLEAALKRARGALRTAEEHHAAILQSTTWKAGRTLSAPVRFLRKLRR